jgi:hypothetical protein
MRARFRIDIIWMTAAFIVAGADVGFAKTGSNHGSEVSAVAKADDSTGADVAEAAKKDQEEKVKPNEANENANSERRLNHGFYVSAAAHCEDVDDPETSESPDFEAPADCNGQAHGRHVSSVARASVGKKDKKNAV